VNGGRPVLQEHWTSTIFDNNLGIWAVTSYAKNFPDSIPKFLLVEVNTRPVRNIDINHLA